MIEGIDDKGAVGEKSQRGSYLSKEQNGKMMQGSSSIKGVESLQAASCCDSPSCVDQELKIADLNPISRARD